MCEDCTENRWDGIERNYTPADVEKLKGSHHFRQEYTLAKRGAEKLWHLMSKTPFVRAFGAQTGMQAVQMAKAGLKAIYVSGWQTAADMNLGSETYPDQSLYPATSVPHFVNRVNKALQRADQIQHLEGGNKIDFGAPIMADAEAGFGGKRNAFVLMKQMIEGGAAAVHFEDQLGSEKKCGHLGGKVLVPTSEFIKTLNAARLASDAMGVPTVLVARTDAESASLLTSDIDQRDNKFLARYEYVDRNQPMMVEYDRTPEGYHKLNPGVESAIARGLAYAPYADMLWMETKTADLDVAKQFADAIHDKFPGKPLMYNCSPSFHWMENFAKKYPEPEYKLWNRVESFQEDLSKMGYRFIFITLAGFHVNNAETFKLAHEYVNTGMKAYVELQEREFEMQSNWGFEAVKHQREVGTGYFDEVDKVASGGQSSTSAMEGSTEKGQFNK